MNSIVYHVSFPHIGISLSVSPIAAKIGGITIHWYGVIIAIGFLLSFIYVMKRAKSFNIDKDKFSDAVIAGLILGIIGARLYYVVFYPGNNYRENPIEILNISQGGIAIYGGIIGGITGGIIACKYRNIDILSALDLSSLGFLIGQSIGRWGNFVNQEAFGTETSLPWGMMSERTNYQLVHPCFLYESIWCAIGFILIHLYSKKGGRFNGELFLIYIVWYSFGRAFIEGLRTDSLYIPMVNLRVSQILAIVLIIAGSLTFTIIKIGKKRRL